MDLSSVYVKVENFISKLGVDPKGCRMENPGSWSLTKGSAEVWIDVMEINQHGYFQCMGPISPVPTTRTQEFFQEILETNHQLYGVGMTKFKDWIYIKAIRETDGLDENEIESTVMRIGNYADDYDDYFKNKYFGTGK
jgi:glycyl-tRNA synthetase alpha subunit